MTMSETETGDGQPGTGYEDQAAAFIAEAERYAALGLPALPDNPAAAAAMRAAGYDVLARVVRVSVIAAAVSVPGEAMERWIHPDELAAALGVPVQELAGVEFIATLRETPETGPVLSGFRPVLASQPAAEGREMTVRCLLLVGDQAELVTDDGEPDDIARWPAAAIAADTGLPLEDLPGTRLRVRVTEQDGRVLFSGFSLLP